MLTTSSDMNYRKYRGDRGTGIAVDRRKPETFFSAIHTTDVKRNRGSRSSGRSGRKNLAIAREYKRAAFAVGSAAGGYRSFIPTNAGPALDEKLMETQPSLPAGDTVPNPMNTGFAKYPDLYPDRYSRARKIFCRPVNRPKRYISRDAMPDETVSFEKMKAFYAEKDWIAERIESLEGDLRAIARMSPLAAVNYIRQGMGYDEYLIEYAAFRRMRPEELLETADELKESAAGFKTFDEWFAHIEAYKEELLRQAAQRRTETDAITLATMHSAKGLEFPIVYILDANEGITPHSRAMLDEDMEEERRLFYVAMTRAKTRLHVYAVRERYHKKAEVSRFVWEYLGRDGDSR